MSIYAALWNMKFPANGHTSMFDEPWVEIWAQAVPCHIGHPKYYPEGDPYADFLPPVVDDPDDGPYRAVFIIRAGTEKHIQRYINPLVVLTGVEYDAITWQELWDRIAEAIAAQDGVPIQRDEESRS